MSSLTMACRSAASAQKCKELGRAEHIMQRPASAPADAAALCRSFKLAMRCFVLLPVRRDGAECRQLVAEGPPSSSESAGVTDVRQESTSMPPLTAILSLFGPEVLPSWSWSIASPCSARRMLTARKSDALYFQVRAKAQACSAALYKLLSCPRRRCHAVSCSHPPLVCYGAAFPWAGIQRTNCSVLFSPSQPG